MCVNYKNAIIVKQELRACKSLYKEFGAYRVTLSVKFWSFLPDQEHFKNQAFKLAPAFLKNFEILMKICRSQTV